MYGRLQKGHELTPGDVDGAIRMAEAADAQLNLPSLEPKGRLAMAQIVFTATDLKTLCINAVRLFVNGATASVPTQSGSADAGTRVMRSDYADLDPQLQQPAE